MECVSLCKELRLDFIELNMNLPQYQLEQIDIRSLQETADKYNHLYTIHLDENLDFLSP